MKRLIYIYIAIAMPLSAMAQETTAVAKELGDKAYADKNYKDAINIYETLIAEQGGSSSLYYNLGNSYYRDNELGKAILNYERALRIDANDEDTKANLEFVQSKIVDKIPQDDVVFYKRWGNRIAGMFSKDTWGIIGISTFTLMLLSLFYFLFWNKFRKFSMNIASICLLFTIIANVSAYNIGKPAGELPEAIIMDELVVVKSSPDSSGTELTKIHEGLKVKIIDGTLTDWVKIEANNGNRVVGWVNTKSLERI